MKRTINIAEFYKTCGDCVRRASQGDQTLVADKDGRIRLVIGMDKDFDSPFTDEDREEIEEIAGDREEIEEIDDPRRSTWLD